MVEAIFFDIDGTLLTRQGTIRKSSKTAIAEAQSLGIVCGVASGRAPFEIPRVLKGLPIDVTISYSGALVHTAGAYVYERHFDQETVAAMTQFFDEENRQAILCSQFRQQGSFTIRFGHSYYIAKVLTFLPEWFPTETARHILQKWSPNRRKNRYANLSILKEPIHQCVLFCSEKETESIRERLPQVDVLRSNPYSVDLVPKGVNKKAGLDIFSKSRGFTIKDIMVFGDHQNDIEMIKEAGIGVAMGNAKPEVKASSDYVTTSHQGDGIREAMKHFKIFKK